MKKRRKISLCYFGEGNGQGGAESDAANGAAETMAQPEANEAAAETASHSDGVRDAAIVLESEASAEMADEAIPVAADESGTAPGEADVIDSERTAAASHYGELCRQSAALKAVYPSFSLRDELRNPTFLRLTAPGGVSVEDAFYTVHRKELGAAALQVIAQRTAEKLSSAVISGSRRPIENGAKSTAATINTFDYRAATPSQREAFKRDLRLRMARGEKVYPN